MEDRTIKILMIEDNTDHSELIEIMLNKDMIEDFELECFETLQEGLERLRKGNVDIILLDLSLPDSWGSETFAAVYAENPDVPIVILSCLDDEELTLDVVHKGAQDYLIKDKADGSHLVRSINYAMERHRVLEELKQKTEALRISEERNRSILDAIPDEIIRVSGNGEILDYKEASNETAGLKNKFIGRKIEELMPREIVEKIMNSGQKSQQTGEAQNFDYSFSLNNDTKNYEARVVASAGNEFIVFIRDNTENSIEV
ncbi:response regulator [Candidatus Poribacteria bacterium]|nr:response regulator [Candidatus Poribacteria bacterium]